MHQGQPGEAPALRESAQKTFAGLQSSGYAGPVMVGSGMKDETALTKQDLADAKALLGDLDGALSILLDLLHKAKPWPRPDRRTRLAGV